MPKKPLGDFKLSREAFVALFQNPFRYTKDQWAGVERELPKGADKETAKQALEEQLTVYRTLMDQPVLWQLGLRFAMSDNKLHRLLKAFAHFHKERTHPYDGDESDEERNRLQEALQVIIAYFDERASRTRKILSTKPRSGPDTSDRDMLLGELLLIWIDAGGKLRTSTKEGKGSGPLVRYLIVASAPVLKKELTPDAARKVVRNILDEIRGDGVG